MRGRLLVIVPLAATVLLAGCVTGGSDPATYVSDRGATLNAHGNDGGEQTE